MTPSGAACPFCGGTEFRQLFETGDKLFQTTNRVFAVVECAGCELLRLYPWPSPEELKTYYPSGYWLSPVNGLDDRFSELYRRLVLRDHVAFVISTLKRLGGNAVLDVGCGGALLARLLRDKGYRCIGLDFSEQAARVSWRTNRVPIVIGDFAHPPFAASTFAAVTMFHVLEHLYEPAAYVSAAAKCLKPGGSLIVQVPNASSWQFRVFGENWYGVDAPRHLVNFRTRDVNALLERCGFKVVRYKFFSLRDNPASLASSLAPFLDPKARRVRHLPETKRLRLAKDLAYLSLLMAAIPLTALEAAFRVGSTVMIEARRL